MARRCDCDPLPYAETRIATGLRDREPDSAAPGSVFALHIDAESALLEYLKMYYKLGPAGRALDRFGVVEFATTVAPGVRDVLLTGKLFEAVERNSRNKELSWSLIKHLSLSESVIAEALNGNGPVRPSAYDDAKVKALIPYAAAEKQALASARLVVPGFPNNAKAMDIFIEEFSNAMLGTKDPQTAMSDMKKRVVPLLPAKS